MHFYRLENKIISQKNRLRQVLFKVDRAKKILAPIVAILKFALLALGENQSPLYQRHY